MNDMDYKWPECPVCHEDELGSVVMLRWHGCNGGRPSIEDCKRGEFYCYMCGFQGLVKFETVVTETLVATR